MGLMKDRRGQATVEMALFLPVAIALAAVTVNALLFMGECAAFDRAAAQAVRACATSPSQGQYGKGGDLVASELRKEFDRQNLQGSVSSSGGSQAHTTYTATLRFWPTLFGLGLKSAVMGVELPVLTHSTSLTVETYKPGVLL